VGIQWEQQSFIVSFLFPKFLLLFLLLFFREDAT